MIKRGLRNWFKCKKAVVMDFLPWILISLAVLVVLVIAIFYMKNAGDTWIMKLKNLFKGG